MPICSVDGCSRTVDAKNLCSMHYQRMWRNGDPEKKLVFRGEPAWYKFFSSIKITNSCWIWSGSKSVDGYGRLFVGNKSIKAHRFSFELNIGKIPEGFFILHKCDNPICVRPGHLFAGTQAQNMADKINKRRDNMKLLLSGDNHWMRKKPHKIARGESCGRSNLTDEAVSEIRRLHAQGGITQRKLAEMYGIGYKNLHLILAGKTWKHLIPDQCHKAKAA